MTAIVQALCTTSPSVFGRGNGRPASVIAILSPRPWCTRQSKKLQYYSTGAGAGSVGVTGSGTGGLVLFGSLGSAGFPAGFDTSTSSSFRSLVFSSPARHTNEWMRPHFGQVACMLPSPFMSRLKLCSERRRRVIMRGLTTWATTPVQVSWLLVSRFGYPQMIFFSAIWSPLWLWCYCITFSNGCVVLARVFLPRLVLAVACGSHINSSGGCAVASCRRMVIA